MRSLTSITPGIASAFDRSGSLAACKICIETMSRIPGQCMRDVQYGLSLGDPFSRFAPKGQRTTRVFPDNVTWNNPMAHNRRCRRPAL